MGYGSNEFNVQSPTEGGVNMTMIFPPVSRSSTASVPTPPSFALGTGTKTPPGFATEAVTAAAM
jgi:hypothetical protein